VRPWQHVLEPLHGYLLLAESLHADSLAFADAWNFGPADDDARTVGWIVSRVVEHWGHGGAWSQLRGDAPHEANGLKVDASRARAKLGWAPRLKLADAVGWTVDWYRRVNAGAAVRALTEEQFVRYCAMDAGAP